MHIFTSLVVAAVLSLSIEAAPQRPLAAVQIVAVSSTVVVDAERVKEPSAAHAAEQVLKGALIRSGLQVGESPIRAHIELEEFTGGNAVKRTLLGFGSGRSTVAGRLVFTDASGSELASVQIKVRGRVLFSGYDGNDAQRRQATNAFEKRLAEEIAKLR